ncbi:glycosyltransferase, partial [Pseudomonas sp. GW101-1A09]
GIETAIRAVPALVRDHPNLLYMIVGATHPNLVRDEGERYRDSLVALATELGVIENICFVDRYLSLDELLDHLAACDIYLSPYPNEAQIVSG